MRKILPSFSRLFIFSLIFITFISCSEGEKINIFTVQDDINLGKRVRDEILNSPQEYTILSKAQYPEAYQYLEGIKNEIITKADLNYANRFEWEVYIIQNDEVLNAFVAPGGYIFFYTGLLKYLESADHLAGIMAHEIAHADLRHSTQNMTKIYGVTILLQVVLGDGGDLLTDISRNLATNLSALGFSRQTETEADAFSVEYLATTMYACNGTAGFFEKLLQEGQVSQTPSWLSTHPDSQQRVNAINEKAQSISCQTSPSNQNYQNFINLLP